MALSDAEARAIFDRRRRAWLAEDVDAYLDCWVDDLILETPGRVIRGRADYETMVRGSLTWAKPTRFDVHHVAADGDVVLADWTITVERRADGEPVAWRGMSACELRDGRIVWWREYYQDPGGLARAARPAGR